MVLDNSESFNQLDASGLPTPICPNCSSEWVMIPVKFCQNTYTIIQYGLEGICFSCNSKLTVCTPLDIPDDRVTPERGQDA